MFPEIHLWYSLFFNKAAVLRPATLLKKRLWHRCFPVNFAKFLRITFLTVYHQWLHLKRPFQKFFYKKRRKVPVAVYLWKIWEIYRVTCEISFLYFEPKRSKIILHKMQNLAKFLFKILLSLTSPVSSGRTKVTMVEVLINTFMHNVVKWPNIP